jgi:hypothetical protein
MYKSDPEQKPAVTDKSLSYSFSVNPNAERVINAPIPLLATEMVIKPESWEVERRRTMFVPDSIHIIFNGDVPASSPLANSFCDLFHAEINGKKLTLNAKDDGISKDMVKDVLSLLHEHRSISTYDTEEAAKKFGVECPIDINPQAGAAFRERTFPNVAKGSIEKIIKSHGSPQDLSPKGTHR